MHGHEISEGASEPGAGLNGVFSLSSGCGCEHICNERGPYSQSGVTVVDRQTTEQQRGDGIRRVLGDGTGGY